jgi:hypothetical protein
MTAIYDQAESQARRDLAVSQASVLWGPAVRFLRKELPTDVQVQIRGKIEANDGEWPWAYHQVWGMSIRNLLRTNGFGEREFGIANLDNVYVELVEQAVMFARIAS